MSMEENIIVQILGLDGSRIRDEEGEAFRLRAERESGQYPIKIKIIRETDRGIIGTVDFGVGQNDRSARPVLRLGSIDIKDRGLFTAFMTLMSDIIPKGPELLIDSMEDMDAIIDLSKGRKWIMTDMGGIMRRCGWEPSSISIFESSTSNMAALLDRERRFDDRAYNPDLFRSMLRKALQGAERAQMPIGVRICVTLVKIEQPVAETSSIIHVISEEENKKVVDKIATIFRGYSFKNRDLLSGLADLENNRIKNRDLIYIGNYLFKLLLLDYVTRKYPEADNLVLHKFINEAQSVSNREGMASMYEAIYEEYAGLVPSYHYNRQGFVMGLLGALVVDTGDLTAALSTGRCALEKYFDRFALGENGSTKGSAYASSDNGHYEDKINDVMPLIKPFIPEGIPLKKILRVRLKVLSSGSILGGYRDAALGDAILDSIVIYEIFKRYRFNDDHLFYLQKHEQLVNGEFTARVIMNKLDPDNNGLSNSAVERGQNLFETLVAIVYESNGGANGDGFNKTREFIFTMFKDYVEGRSQLINRSVASFINETINNASNELSVKGSGAALTPSALLLGRAIHASSSAAADVILQTKNGKNLILYADDILERGAVSDLAYVLKNTQLLDNSAIVLYEKKPGRAKLAEDVIRSADSGNKVKIIIVTSQDLMDKNGWEDINTEYPDEAKELSSLIRYLRSHYAMNNGNILGAIKGFTNEEHVRGITDISRAEHMPVVSFADDEGVYSFTEALSILIATRNDDAPPAVKEWFRLLKPIMKEDVEKAYQDYRRVLEVAINA